jgi:hypothetical protein
VPGPEDGRDVSHETWESIVHHWPMTIFVPAVLVVLATLAAIVRMYDRD